GLELLSVCRCSSRMLVCLKAAAIRIGLTPATAVSGTANRNTTCRSPSAETSTVCADGSPGHRRLSTTEHTTSWPKSRGFERIAPTASVSPGTQVVSELKVSPGYGGVPQHRVHAEAAL